MSLADEIEKLNHLKSSGVITEEEFQEAKKKLLNQTGTLENKLSLGGTTFDVKQWCMFIHFAQLIPGCGFIISILLWQIKKDESEQIDLHGKMVTNWLISALIYGVISGILIFVLIGFPLIIALGILSMAFPIIGGLKANEGIFWSYPITIKFIK